MSRARSLLLLLVLLAGAGSTLALGTERELFDRAAKVAVVELVEWAGWESPPDIHPGRKYRYQILHVKDRELFKGPPHPARYGYDVVMIPVKGRLHAPALALGRPLQEQDLPRDGSFLVYLTRDQHGVLTLLEGTEGLFVYPGATRLRNLREWAKPARQGPPSRR